MRQRIPLVAREVRVLPGALSQIQVLGLTLAALLAFAANSILARLALTTTEIDPALYTLVRITAGAALLSLLLAWRGRSSGSPSNGWVGAATLVLYAFAFSFAYLYLNAATGALVLFAWAQITMMTAGLWRGERLNLLQGFGFMLAVGGIGLLLIPNASMPPWQGFLLMSISGIAWGVYSLRGHDMQLAISTTSGDFLRAVPIATVLSLFALPFWSPDPVGLVYAGLSGAIASGVGYAIWYRALPELRTTHASSAQLAIPLLVALLGILILSEPLTLRFILAMIAILVGISLVTRLRRQKG